MNVVAILLLHIFGTFDKSILLQDKTMTRKEIKELLPILQAFAEGKTIECSFNDEPWAETNNLLFCDGSKYRIKSDKSEPKYRPFKSQKECWEEMHKHSDFGWVKFCNSICFIQNISFNKITVISDEEICSTSFEGGFTNMKFADGTPFGIKE